MSWLPHETAGLALMLALAVDWLLRMPNALHPVAWFGKLAGFLIARAPTTGRAVPGLVGLLLATCLPAASAYVVSRLIASAGVYPHLRFVLQVFFLSASFTLFGLLDAARKLDRALQHEGLDVARARLSWLCSRDASALDASQLANGTIESLAENLSDSVVAPLFYFALFGIEGAVAYRAINTLDAMIGYRGRYEWLGKAAARLDDLANLLPARISALLLLVGAAFERDAEVSITRGARTWWRDRMRTESPNAGHPMAMAAGLLGVCLDKPSIYTLGAQLRAPAREDIERAALLVRRAGALSVLATWLIVRHHAVPGFPMYFGALLHG